MVQPLMSPGKAWARVRNLGPTGEKQSERCRLARTRWMKKAQRSSCVGRSPCSWPRTRADLADDGVVLVAREEVGQLARVEEDVDVLEEALLLDLLVGEEEHGRLALHARAPVERLEVLEQVARVVRLVMVIWKKVAWPMKAPSRVRRLLARAAHADEQRAAARDGEEARDAHQVLERVVEEHEVIASSLKPSLNLLHVLDRELLDLLEARHRLVDLGRGPTSSVSGSTSPSRRKSTK